MNRSGFALRLAVRGCVMAALLCAPESARAQAVPAGPARLIGRVVERVSGVAIANAEVLFVNSGRVVTCDSAGQFSVAGLIAGEIHLVVRAERYAPARIVVNLQPGDDLRVQIEVDSARVLSSAQRLEGMSVSARAPLLNYRLVEFERRRRAGIGQFLTDDEIRSSGAANLTDATRSMRGVTSHCGGTECHIQMARAQPNCPPEYIVDGQVDNLFGPLTPIRDIIALEVYTGASDVPGEFAGTRAGCGVIAIWTLSGPPRHRR